MPAYPVVCTSCAFAEDQYHRMPAGGGAPELDPCARCANPVKRVFTPIAEIGTGNRMHQIVDRSLCPTAGPTVFNSRADWQAEMKRRGVRPMEAGEARDQARFEKERKERCDREYRAQLETRIDKAIDKAIDTIGGA